MRAACAGFIVTCLAGGIGVGVFCGCETVEPYDKTLTIVPSSTNLTTEGESVVFTVAINAVSNLTVSGATTNDVVTGPPVLLPLIWSVSDPALGQIRASGGLSAIYERKGAAEGNNYIMVRDRGARYEAVATVSQLPVP